jgi:hypothetical protein
MHNIYARTKYIRVYYILYARSLICILRSYDARRGVLEYCTSTKSSHTMQTLASISCSSSMYRVCIHGLDYELVVYYAYVTAHILYELVVK